MLFETLVSDLDSVQQDFPQQLEGFLLFFGARGWRVCGLWHASHRALAHVAHLSARSRGGGGAEL